MNNITFSEETFSQIPKKIKIVKQTRQEKIQIKKEEEFKKKEKIINIFKNISMLEDNKMEFSDIGTQNEYWLNEEEKAIFLELDPNFTFFKKLSINGQMQFYASFENEERKNILIKIYNFTEEEVNLINDYISLDDFTLEETLEMKNDPEGVAKNIEKQRKEDEDEDGDREFFSNLINKN
jgi:hypothetical protein